ncbi:dihydroxyacetone kinase subunit DhaL [Trichococcus palustris]|nr:dihydroxyacetone kinase subunit DhaL [Trichococcus palustris]
MMVNLEKVQEWITLFIESLCGKQAYLDRLDSFIGDGDHGMNMAHGAVALRRTFEQDPPQSVEELLRRTGMTLISNVGGTAGALYGSAFLEMAKASQTSDDLGKILEAGLGGIQKIGKAEASEKTMVDVWLPVIAAVETKQLTAEKIEAAVASTKDIQATKGRASYLGAGSHGHVDPGAASSGYLFQAMMDGGVYDG